MATSELQASIAVRALDFYQANGWDGRKLPAMLRAVFRRTCALERLQFLERVVNSAIADGRHLRHPFYAFCRLTGDDALLTRLTVQHVMAYASAIDELSLLRPRPTARAWRSLEQDVKSLLAEAVTPTELDLYLKLILTDAAAFPQDAQIDLDLFGELTSAFRDLLAQRPGAAEVELIAVALDQQRRSSFTALGLIRAYLDLSFFEVPGTTIAQPSLVAQYYNAVTRFSAQGRTPATPIFRRLLDHLVRSVGAAETVAVFAAGACVLAGEGRHQELTKLQELCGKVDRWTVRPQLLRNLVRAIDDGEITTRADVFKHLERAGAHGALEKLRNAADSKSVLLALAAFREFTESALGDLSGVVRFEETPRANERMADYQGRFVRPSGHDLTPQRPSQAADEVRSPLEIDEQQFSTLTRLHDKFFGFSALRFAAQRTPTRGAAELAHFGNDVGRVSYLNAREVTGFPGRGFFIHGVRLEHVFVRDDTGASSGRDPFHAYLAAWPSLAAEFRDLETAEFLFARGMILVSCTTPFKYDLTFPDGARRQMSLAIFNDHFRNPLSCEACLIPTALLQSRLRRCFVGYDDYTGFQPQRPDANQTIAGIRELMADANFGSQIISVGGPERLRAGFPELRDATPLAADEAIWNRYRASVAEHNNRIAAWERRGHDYYFSEADLQQNRLLVAASAELARRGAEIAR